MSRPTTHIIFSLLLAPLCSCGDNVWRKLPEEKDITFEGTAKKPQKTAYRPGQAKDIQLHLTSSDAEAKEAKFKILSAKLADGSNADIDYDSLKLGPNTLHYTPQEPGTHTLTLTVAVEGEEGSAKTIPCTLEAPAAEWQVAGRADDAGNLTLTIAEAPEEWRGEPWLIQSTRWSRGLLGSIANSPRQVQYGENTLAITLQAIALEELPQVHFNLQGPDNTNREINIDLSEACVARLEETYSEDQIQTIRVHNEAVRQQAATYQGNLTGNTRVEAQRSLNELHERTTRLQRETNAQIERLASNLTILRAQDATGLVVLEARHNELQGELSALNDSMNILQPMVTRLRNNDQGAIDPWGVLYEGLQQGQYDEASMAPHLASPLLSDAVNREGAQNKTLLHLAIEQGHVALSRTLLNQGAEVNVRDLSGNAPLHYATEANNQEAISLLLGAGAVQELPPDWQLRGSYEAAGQQMLLTIGDTPGRLQQARDPQAQWRITNTTWSEGINGQIDPNLVLQHGENRIPLAVTMNTLTEQPTVQILLQGPDRAYQRITLDLREVCVSRLQEGERGLIEREDHVNEYVQETEDLFVRDDDGIYQLPPATVTDPRVNREKQTVVGTLLGRLEAFQTQYGRDMQSFSNNLDTLEQTEVNEHLAVFEANNNRLKDAIASLKSAQVQLQQQCTTAHEALFKTLKDEDQEASEVLAEDPNLDANAIDNRFHTFGPERVPLDPRNRTLLHWAAEKGDEEVVKVLLRKSAHINAEDENGSTAFSLAASNGHVNVVRTLLSNRENVNMRSHSNLATLYRALLWDHTDVAETILNNSVDVHVNAQETDGDTALHLAASHGHIEIVELLLRKGSHINVRNNTGETALDRAAASNHFNIVRILLSDRLNVDLSVKPSHGVTALHWAASHGQVEMVELLLRRGARINATNDFGETALHWAAREGHRTVVELLLRRDAHVHVRDTLRRTPLDFAEREGHREIVVLLENAWTRFVNRQG